MGTQLLSNQKPGKGFSSDIDQLVSLTARVPGSNLRFSVVQLCFLPWCHNRTVDMGKLAWTWDNWTGRLVPRMCQTNVLLRYEIHRLFEGRAAGLPNYWNIPHRYTLQHCMRSVVMGFGIALVTTVALTRKGALPPPLPSKSLSFQYPSRLMKNLRSDMLSAPILNRSISTL